MSAVPPVAPEFVHCSDSTKSATAGPRLLAARRLGHSIVAPRPADYLRKHSHIFVLDGAGMLTREETAARKYAIERRCDKMAASKTYDEFEVMLHQMHRLGTYPLNEDVSLVARASFMAD
jgi:hypothetical protein